MRYLMHNREASLKLEKRIKDYFLKIKTIEIKINFLNKEYIGIVDVESFRWLSNFDCFNCLTNCCVQFPYNFNSKAREVILNNLKEYNELTKAVSIMKEEGMTEKEIEESIKLDDMLIPKEFEEKVFDRCTCSCVYIDKSLCALHKICIDKGMTLEEIIDTKPFWCSIYPLEMIEDGNKLYIFVPTQGNNFLSMNDCDFPCMNIEKAKSPYFRRENPIGFKIGEYKPFIENYYSVLNYIFGDEFTEKILEKLEITIEKIEDEQYIKKR